jgi:hypothetical protein
MSEFVYFTTVGLLLGTILLIFGMKFFSASRQEKARLAAESGQAEALSSIREGLADVKARLAVIEKILKDVE